LADDPWSNPNPERSYSFLSISFFIHISVFEDFLRSGLTLTNDRTF
jgi:hypothetical protein